MIIEDNNGNGEVSFEDAVNALEQNIEEQLEPDDDDDAHNPKQKDDEDNASKQVPETSEEDDRPEEEGEVDDESEEGEEEEVETTDTDNADGDEPDEDYFEIGDKKYTEDELVELHDSGLRREDYTKKTQELAQERKEFEAKKETEIAETKAELEKTIGELKKHMEAFKGEEYTPEQLAELAVDDPYEYQKVIAKQDAQRRLTDELTKYDEQELKAKQEKEKKEFEDYAQAQTDIIVKAVPDFANDFDNTYKKVLDHMVESGMDENTVHAIVDASVIKAFYDSMKLKELTNKGQDIAKKKVRKVSKQKAVQNTKTETSNTKRKEKLSKAKTLDDMVGILNEDAFGS